ncbi:uncharacterized protein LOC135332158 [Halichondria panicea]|uniref:uncharacterized protein LOC135332158 n=1 Tax=Halichondria panicea TaxID=6063 RepID=UPI00312B3FEF
MCSLLYKNRKKGGILFLSCILAILVWHSRELERIYTFHKVNREVDILHEENGNYIQLDLAVDRKNLTKSTEVEPETTTRYNGPVTESIEKPPKNTPPMVDFVVRSAYIDTRERNGHKNSTVIFAEISKDVRKFGLIVGCGVDTIDAKEYKVESLYDSWIQKRMGHLTHEEIMITCYDLEAHENSTAFIAYHPAPNSIEISTGTVEITYSPKRKYGKNKTVVCTLAFGKPPWLKEWLLYQQAIGVDLVQMYVEETFIIENESLRIVKGFVEDGFLRVDYRKTYFNSTQIYYHSQLLLNHDCLYRYQGVYEYALFFDTDDFFIPRLPNKNSIRYYLNRFLPKDNQATFKFHWLNLFPECGLTQPKESVKDGNVTQLLKVKQYLDTKNTKFACRPHLTTLVSVHTARAYTENTSVVPTAYGSIAYVGHFRLGMHEVVNIPKTTTCDTLLHDN